MSNKREALHDFYRKKLDEANESEFENARRDLALIETFLLEGHAGFDSIDLAYLQVLMMEANG